MDAFFCSVQLAKAENAHLREVPVAIAAGRYNSDISSCNYAARKKGVAAGQYVSYARQLCPELQLLGYDLKSVEEVAACLYDVVFSTFSSQVNFSLEVYSIDEVMLATDSKDFSEITDLCESVRRQLFEKTGCTASCGIGPNIMLARLCTKLAKPNGCKCLTWDEVGGFMQSLPFSSIHGAGESTVQKVVNLLKKEKVIAEDCSGDDITCGDVQSLSRESLCQGLGKTFGSKFYHLVRGKDERVVKKTGVLEDRLESGKGVPTSLSSSMNYAVRPQSIEDVWKILGDLLMDACRKLERLHLMCSSARVTVLERHPLHPKEPHKFMGRGKCVEFHIPIRFPRHYTSTEREEILQHIQSVLQPLLVLQRAVSDEKRAASFGLRKETDDPAVWTVPLASAGDIVISDVRGMTVQLAGLKVIDDLKRKRESRQTTLFSSFPAQNSKSKDKGTDQPSEVVSSLFQLHRLGWGPAFMEGWRKNASSLADSSPADKEFCHRCAIYALSKEGEGVDCVKEYSDLVHSTFSEL
ncbi:DNA damage repair protein [Angomonas deanei]|uniref:ImpB/mucB/samB family, putative n=1 Tax=Angomonas deanei TaxID=59799 RepID=A0A7G2C2T1_9TRYP|nr:DNA damage repair protein [Angomonas deanei]CAD2214088.1 impB/mucB/samB family, putative [Angomonas deanei]|eukprot:EPY20105.1 DNA damage repair protein [Angomonas deanei]